MKWFSRSLVCLALVAVTACGSSGSSKSDAPTNAPSTTTATATTKASFLARANAICKTMNDEVEALGDPGDDPIRLATTSEKVSVVVRRTLRRLRALRSPPADAPKLAAIYVSVEKVIVDARTFSAALRARDVPAARAAGNQLDADQKKANRDAIVYGLTVCGQ
jgi:hypothetical protein